MFTCGVTKHAISHALRHKVQWKIRYNVTLNVDVFQVYLHGNKTMLFPSDIANRQRAGD